MGQITETIQKGNGKLVRSVIIVLIPALLLNFILTYTAVPEANRAKSEEEWSRLIQTEVTVDKAFKFTKKEIEESKITGSELATIFEDFMK